MRSDRYVSECSGPGGVAPRTLRQARLALIRAWRPTAVNVTHTQSLPLRSWEPGTSAPACPARSAAPRAQFLQASHAPSPRKICIAYRHA